MAKTIKYCDRTIEMPFVVLRWEEKRNFGGLIVVHAILHACQVSLRDNMLIEI